MTAFYARHRLIILICIAAFLLRLAYRLATGQEEFWSNSYYFFYELSHNLIAGKGLTLSQPLLAAVQRPPAYPLLLVPAVLLGGNYLYIVVPQALVGAGTVLCAFLIGQELFSPRAGLLAAALTAIYPYYVVHDTALQETGLLTFCLALSVWLLLVVRISAAPRLWLVAGAILGLSVMVRTTAAPFALGAVVWVWLFGIGPSRRRTARTLTLLACIALIVGAWVIRNAEVVGRPVLDSGAGASFWAAHNPQTFSRYPAGTIDASIEQAFDAMSLADRKKLQGFSGDEFARDEWYLARGQAYLSQQKLGEKLTEAGRKVLAGFSWVLVPAKPGLAQLIYFLSYTPILVLGLAGMALTWRVWRRHSLIYLQFLIFITISAVMWAHTNHRAPLDIYLIVFSAAVLDRFCIRRGSLKMRFSGPLVVECERINV